MISSRWFRAISKREKYQRYAHMLVLFSSPEQANQAIRHGLYIRGAKLRPELLFPEPMRCNKCSQYANHKAADCPAVKDTCGLCGADHRTHTCSAHLPEDLYCVNCKQRGHGAVSRDCPTYWMKKRAMDARNPATKFKYVVMPNDPATWEPAKAVPGPPPPTIPPPPRPPNQPRQWQQGPGAGAYGRPPAATRTGPTPTQTPPATPGRRQQTLEQMLAAPTDAAGTTPPAAPPATSTVAHV